MKLTRRPEASHSESACDCQACAALPFARWQRNAISRYLASLPAQPTERGSVVRTPSKTVRSE